MASISCVRLSNFTRSLSPNLPSPAPPHSLNFRSRKSITLKSSLIDSRFFKNALNKPFRVAFSQKYVNAVSQLVSISEIEAKPVKIDGGLADFPSTSGVYAVFDDQGKLQYMGISRKINSSIKTHTEELPHLCHSVKVLEIVGGDKNALTSAWKAWIEEHIKSGGNLPPGNETGNTLWTARKAKRVKPDIRLTPRPNVELTIPLTELISYVVREHKVVAFIKGSRVAPECGFSHKVLTLLNDLGVEYETVNVLDETHNFGVREAIKTFSQWPTIPQVFIKGEFVGGADIFEEMVTSGEIKKLLA